MGDGETARHEEWTDSIAVRSRPLVVKVKALLAFGPKGEIFTEGTEGYRVREEVLPVARSQGEQDHSLDSGGV